MSGVRKRVKRMARSALESGSQPSQRRASTGDGLATNSAHASASDFLGSQRGASFSSMRPPPLPGGGSGGGGPLPARGSSVGGLDPNYGGHDAPISSGDDTTGPLVSRLHSYSKLRPSAGSEAAGPRPRGSTDLATATSAPLGMRPPSFSSSRGMASELAVLAGLRQASQGSLGRVAGRGAMTPPRPSSPLPHLPSTKEGSAFALSMFNSCQSMPGSAHLSNAGSVPPPRSHPQNMDVALSRLSGEISPTGPACYIYLYYLYMRQGPTWQVRECTGYVHINEACASFTLCNFVARLYMIMFFPCLARAILQACV